MWVAKKEYDRMQWALARVEQLTARVAAAQTTNDWLMHQINRLEHERAKLVETYMGVKLPVPEIGTAAPAVDIDQVLRDPGTLFNDIGDEEAERLGVDWDPEGKVTYGNRK